MTDLDDKILKNAEGPAEASGDGHTIGSAVAPVISNISKRIVRIATVIREWIGGNKELIATIFKVGLAIAAIGIALSTLGVGIITVGFVLSGLATILTTVGAVFGILVTAKKIKTEKEANLSVIVAGSNEAENERIKKKTTTHKTRKKLKNSIKS